MKSSEIQPPNYLCKRTNQLINQQVNRHETSLLYTIKPPQFQHFTSECRSERCAVSVCVARGVETLASVVMSLTSFVSILFLSMIFVYQIHLRVTSESVNDHRRRALSFKCQHPQPRAFKSSDLLKTSALNKKFVPRMTVLYRCDASGCCLNGNSQLECGLKTQMEIELKFQVIYLIDTKTHKKGETEIESRFFKNHTECCCILPDSIGTCYRS